MIKWLKDTLGINRYVVERRSIYDEDWYNLGGIVLSYRGASDSIAASKQYSDRFPHLKIEYRMRLFDGQ